MRFRPRFARFLLRKAACQGQVLSYGGTRASQERSEQWRTPRWSPEGPTPSTLDVLVNGRLLLGDGPQGSSLLLLLVLHVLRRFRRGGCYQGGRQARHLGRRAGKGVKTPPLGTPAFWQGMRAVFRLVHRLRPVVEAELHHRHPPRRHPPRVA